MAYIIDDQKVGFQAIADTSTVRNHPLGTRVRAIDPVYGEGEFIYLQGIASTVVGTVVTYNSAYLTALAAIGSNLPRPVAFAMSANLASAYGWYQIGGLAVASKALATSLAAAAAVGVKTAGFVAASGTGKEIQGALVAAVSSSKSSVSLVTVILAIERPHMQGRVS